MGTVRKPAMDQSPPSHGKFLSVALKPAVNQSSHWSKTRLRRMSAGRVKRRIRRCKQPRVREAFSTWMLYLSISVGSRVSFSLSSLSSPTFCLCRCPTPSPRQQSPQNLLLMLRTSRFYFLFPNIHLLKTKSTALKSFFSSGMILHRLSGTKQLQCHQNC